MELSIIVPARNEQANLSKIIEQLDAVIKKEKINGEIIIVNDNSSDRTKETAEKLAGQKDNLKVICRRPPAGFGRALQEGFTQAKGEIIIPVMADGSDDPEDAIRLFYKIKEGYDLVYGSRFIKGGEIYHYPFFKLLANRLGNYFIKMLFGMKEKDITNALKAYSRRALERIGQIESNYFDITVEMPLKAEVKGLRKTSIPVRWYGRTSGVSKLKLSKMMMVYLKTVLKLYRLKIKGF